MSSVVLGAEAGGETFAGNGASFSDGEGVGGHGKRTRGPDLRLAATTPSSSSSVGKSESIGALYVMRFPRLQACPRVSGLSCRVLMADSQDVGHLVAVNAMFAFAVCSFRRPSRQEWIVVLRLLVV